MQLTAPSHNGHFSHHSVGLCVIKSSCSSQILMLRCLCGFLDNELCLRFHFSPVTLCLCSPPQDSSDDIEDVSLFDADDDVSRRSKKSKIRSVATEGISGMSLFCLSLQAVISHVSRTLEHAAPYPVHCWEIPWQCHLSAGAVTVLSFIPGTQWHRFSTYSSESVPSLFTCSVSS